MKSSRYYQNWLQIVARGATLFLFLSGASLEINKESLIYSLVFLFFNLVTGYLGSHFKYRRMQAIVQEAENGLEKKLKPSKNYQRWLQFSGRGKDVFVFFLGWLLGRGFWFFSIGLLIFQLINGFIMGEFVYLREQAVIREKQTVNAVDENKIVFSI